jgi:phosphohistidine phosphatase
MQLLLMRHAKSDWPDGVSDLERPLNERGLRDAPLMGAALYERGLRPDLVLVSPALRTRMTFEAVQKAFGGDLVFRIEPRLYEVSVQGLLYLLQSLEKDAQRVLIIGHNMTLEDTARLLTDGARSDVQACRRLIAGFKTSCVAVLDGQGSDWSTLAPRSLCLQDFLRPKDLRPAS